MVILKQYPIIKRSFFISIFLMVFAFAKAQSQRNSSDIIFSQSNVQVVDVELNSTIELTIKTTTEKDIRITSSQGGEYKNAIVLNSKIENDTLKITDPLVFLKICLLILNLGIVKLPK